MGAAIIGALIGFLWFNAYPAEVFMGDSGSLGDYFGLPTVGQVGAAKDVSHSALPLLS